MNTAPVVVSDTLRPRRRFCHQYFGQAPRRQQATVPEARITLALISGSSIQTVGIAAMRARSSLSLMFLVGLVSACTSTSGTVYSRNDAQRPWTVQNATVVEVSEATIEGSESQIGTW